MHVPLNKLEEDIDVYFSCIDRVGFFNISGGEPLLYPDLIKLIEYIAINYSDKIEAYAMFTSCTIPMSDELCSVIKSSNMHIICDDYTTSVPNYKSIFTENLKKLDKYEILYTKSGVKKFFILFPLIGKHNYSAQDLITKSENCRKEMLYQDIKNKHMYSCCYASYAMTAGLNIETDNDYYDLSNYSGTAIEKRELIEFRLGYNKNGYVDFCQYCNGFPSINHYSDEEGVSQVKGTLEWREDE
jgi:MoaA/NifB/PqqE/SkfB family radical SAM enzyme